MVLMFSGIERPTTRALLVMVLIGCRSQSSGGGPPQQQTVGDLPAVATGCPDVAVGDTLVFSDVRSVEQTGDLSGFQFALIRGDTGWGGVSREAAGELGPPMPLVEVTIEAASRATAFVVPNGPDSSRFSGTMSCDSLFGWFKAYRSTPARWSVYRRVRS